MYDDLLNKVRLKEFEIEALIESFKQFFLPTDHIWVFGSRADKNRRGGDIDLYIETSLNSNDVNVARAAFERALCDKIGDQKIDIVVHIISDNFHLPIYDVAKAEGIKIL